MRGRLGVNRSGLGRMRRAWLGLLLPVAGVLWLAPAARASTIDLGSGTEPTVAVDGAGTAFIAYDGVEPLNPVVHFCKLPRGASACSQSLTLVPGNGSVTPPYIFVDAAGTVRVLTSRYGFSTGPVVQDLLYTSTDGGQTFSAPVSVGTVSPLDGDAIAGPGGSISITNGADGATHAYQALPTDGSSAAGALAALSPAAYRFEGSIGLVDPSTPLVTFNDGHAQPSTTAFSVYTGSGPLNDGMSWSAPKVIATGESHSQLAGGPSGLFDMLWRDRGDLVVRKYDSAAKSFVAPVAIPGATSSRVENYLFQDGAGELHAVWGHPSDTGERLDYSTSTNGVDWSAPTTVTTDVVLGGLRAALAADHAGLAVWSSGAGTGQRVHAAPLPSAGASSAVLRKLLLAVIAPAGKNARIGALLKHRGYRLSFHAPVAGTLTVAWYLVSKPARRGKAKRKPTPVLVAIGHLRLTKAGSAKLTIKLTTAGKQLLKHAKTLKLSGQASFTLTGQPTVTTTTTFTIRKSP